MLIMVVEMKIMMVLVVIWMIMNLGKVAKQASKSGGCAS